jgi:hypothetical protein
MYATMNADPSMPVRVLACDEDDVDGAFASTGS